jgi:hypothetical protein
VSIVRLPRVSTRVLVAAVAVSGALLAGCGTGPSQVGASAIVGDQSVSLSETQQRVDRALSQPNLVDSVTPNVVANLVQLDPNNPKYQNLSPDQQRTITQALLARVIVTKQVQHLLLQRAAQEARITVSPEQVTAALAIPGMSRQLAAGSLAFDPPALREAMGDWLTAQALAIRDMDRLAITVDEVVAGSREQALTAARALAAGGSTAAEALRAAGSNARIGVRMTAVQAARTGSTFLLGTPAGEVVAANTGQDSWGVWRVTRRDLVGPPATRPSATSQVGADGLQSIGVQLLQPLAERIGVRVNPRYGTWDSPNLMVLSPDQQPSIVLPASAS